MLTKRFLFLVGVLVALNTALWLTPAGLAVRQAALPQLFGKSLVRAEVYTNNGQDWRVARGVITSASLTQLTLTEAPNGHVETIGLSPATKVVGLGKSLPVSALTNGWEVLVTWPANGTADLVKVEKRGSGKSGGGRGH